MPQYKLTYFPIRGKAECIRMVFAVAGVEFEDVRVHPQDWPKLKECRYYNISKQRTLSRTLYPIVFLG